MFNKNSDNIAIDFINKSDGFVEIDHLNFKYLIWLLI